MRARPRITLPAQRWIPVDQWFDALDVQDPPTDDGTPRGRRYAEALAGARRKAARRSGHA